MDPLDFLQSHFDALEARLVEVAGFPFKLLYKPLTTEQTFKYVKALKSSVPTEQARLFAELLIETVTLENGQPAFPMTKGKTPPLEVLTRRTPPEIFSRLAEHLGEDSRKEDAEDLEKKSGPPDQACSLPATSSPTEPAVD